MRVEEAIYGEVNGGHALRAASGDRQFALSIASRLDLPDNAPVGVLWSPYVSGFAMGEHYVIARTFIDEAAPRSGMVFSHALIVPLKELLGVQNLHSLFRRLATSVDQIDAAVGYNLEKDLSNPQVAADFVGAVNALTSRGNGPVVRLGTDGFEALVASLWANLWAETRANFGFRLSFGPTDVIEKSAPILVCTPVNLAARWSRFRTINVEDQIPLSPSAALLTGGSDPGPILDFGREIGAGLQKVSELSLLEHAHGVALKPAGFDDFLTVVRLVDKISPDPTNGREKKKVITDNLEGCIASATPNQILSMRNLSLSGFPVMTELWEGVERWFVERQFAVADDNSMLEIVGCAVNADGAVDSWQAAVVKGIATAAHSSKSYFPSALWRWVLARTDLLDAVFRLLPIEPSVEILIAESTPEKLPALFGQALLVLLRERSWMAVHGSVLSALECPVEAVRKQIEVEGKVASRIGLGFALRFASPEQILDCSIRLKDQRLIDLAADTVILNPRIFADVLPDELVEQKIWDAVLRKNSGFWNAPSAHFASRDKLLGKLIDGEEIYQSLLVSLSSTPLADLCDFVRRERVWNKLEGATQFAYINATAKGWLKRAAQGDTLFVPDTILETAIIKCPEIDAMLLDGSLNLGARIQIIESLSQLDEHRFINWLHALFSQRMTLSSLESERVGRLIHRNDWQQAVQEILARYPSRTDLKPALRVCLSMLGRLTRWRLGISAVTVDEKWDAFAELAAQLYSGGPDHDEIWARAGGDNSDLQRNGSGKSMWLLAFAKVRNGRGPSPTRLLNEMTRDYSSNEELRFIVNDTDIAGTRRRW
jgi:hypothetical protein